MNDDIKQPNTGATAEDKPDLQEVSSTETQTETTTTETDIAQPAEAPVVATPEPEEKAKSSGGSKVAVWVILVILALLIGGGLGYIFGTNNDKVTPEQQALQQQVTDLENQLDEATKNAASNASTEKDSQIATLQAENATLTTQNADLTAENKELQAKIDELEDASTGTDTTN